jgi:hypothetical protein
MLPLAAQQQDLLLTQQQEQQQQLAGLHQQLQNREQHQAWLSKDNLQPHRTSSKSMVSSSIHDSIKCSSLRSSVTQR